MINRSVSPSSIKSVVKRVDVGNDERCTASETYKVDISKKRDEGCGNEMKRKRDVSVSSSKRTRIEELCYGLGAYTLVQVLFFKGHEEYTKNYNTFKVKKGGYCGMRNYIIAYINIVLSIKTCGCGQFIAENENHGNILLLRVDRYCDNMEKSNTTQFSIFGDYCESNLPKINERKIIDLIEKVN